MNKKELMAEIKKSSAEFSLYINGEYKPKEGENIHELIRATNQRLVDLFREVDLLG